MEKLREWLDLTRMPISQLAEEIGAHPNSVYNWLDGRASPSGLMLRKIHERTNIPLDDLVPRSGA